MSEQTLETIYQSPAMQISLLTQLFEYKNQVQITWLNISTMDECILGGYNEKLTEQLLNMNEKLFSKLGSILKYIEIYVACSFFII